MPSQPLAISHPLVRMPAAPVIIAGLWLIISPWFLPGGFPPAAAWTQVSAGIVAIFLAARTIRKPLAHWIAWTLIALSLWLLFSPWITGYSGHPGAKYNSTICATIIVCFSSWGLIATVVADALDH